MMIMISKYPFTLFISLLVCLNRDVLYICNQRKRENGSAVVFHCPMQERESVCVYMCAFVCGRYGLGKGYRERNDDQVYKETLS